MRLDFYRVLNFIKEISVFNICYMSFKVNNIIGRGEGKPFSFM